MREVSYTSLFDVSGSTSGSRSACAGTRTRGCWEDASSLTPPRLPGHSGTSIRTLGQPRPKTTPVWIGIGESCRAATTRGNTLCSKDDYVFLSSSRPFHFKLKVHFGTNFECSFNNVIHKCYQMHTNVNTISIKTV